MIPQPAENSSQNSVTTSYPLPVQMAGRVSSVCSAVTKSGSVVTVSGSHVTYFPTCSGTCASLAPMALSPNSRQKRSAVRFSSTAVCR